MHLHKTPSAGTAPIMDWAKLSAAVDNDPAFVNELVALFLNVLPETMDGIRYGIADGHSRNTRNAAHTLKGVSGNIRAMEVFRIAGELEKLGASGDLTGADEAFLRLESAVTRLTAALRSNLGEERKTT